VPGKLSPDLQPGALKSILRQAGLKDRPHALCRRDRKRREKFLCLRGGAGGVTVLPEATVTLFSDVLKGEKYEFKP
jgi:hypothetical protein